MSSTSALTIEYEEVEILGAPALFTPLRIESETVPRGMFHYELRHMDDDGGVPCQMARLIAVNFFGTVLTSNPIQLTADGSRNLGPEDFAFTRNEAVTRIPAFLAEYPAMGKDYMELYPMKVEETDLFYSMSAKEDRLNGCIGHLRGDFGFGEQFYTTWWPHQENRLNGHEFQVDLERVVDWLRQDFSPLKNLRAMSGFCFTSGDEAKIGGKNSRHYGYRIETKRFQYMLRCFPQQGDYNFYLYCYDKMARLEELKRQPLLKKKDEIEK